MYIAGMKTTRGSRRIPPVLVAAAISAAVTNSIVAADGNAARIVNIATRASIGGAAGTPIAGFVVNGTGTKRMLIRACGPALSGFGVAGALADPSLSLASGPVTIATNDNWLTSDGPMMAATGAFAFADGSRDAAIVASLSAGSYTCPVTVSGAESGIVLLEVYDASSTAASAIVNASTGAFVGTGASVLIPGFTISGSGTVQLLIRAAGPALSAFEVSSVLADPTLTLYRDSTVLATNDDWSTSGNPTDITSSAAAVGAFAFAPGSKDAAILTSLPAGSYTAVVSGVGNSSGTALVELYTVAATATTPSSSAPFTPRFARIPGGSFTPAAGIANAAGPAGDFLHRFGDPARYAQGEPPRVLENWDNATSGHKQMGGSHDAHWIRPGLPGAGHLLVFNNGQYLFQRTPHSSAIQINPQLDADGRDAGCYVNPPSAGYRSQAYDKDTDNPVRQVTRQIVWSYAAINSHGFSHIGSSAQRLPNGNTFICSDTEGHLFEVTSDGKLVWEYINPVTREGAVKTLGDVLPMTNSIFRAFRVPLDHPALKGRELTPEGTITERAAQGLDPQPRARPPGDRGKKKGDGKGRGAAGEPQQDQ